MNQKTSQWKKFQNVRICVIFKTTTRCSSKIALKHYFHHNILWCEKRFKNPVYKYVKFIRNDEIMNNKPFCYILHFPDIDLRYLGLRVGKDRDPTSLLKKYKTSSPKVKRLLKEGHVAVVEDIIYFESIDAAAEYESTRADDIVKDPKWINQQSRKYHYTGIGKHYPRYSKTLSCLHFKF